MVLGPWGLKSVGETWRGMFFFKRILGKWLYIFEGLIQFIALIPKKDIGLVIRQFTCFSSKDLGTFSWMIKAFWGEDSLILKHQFCGCVLAEVVVIFAQDEQKGS